MSIYSDTIEATGLDPFGPCPVNMSYEDDEPWFPLNKADALARKIARGMDTTMSTWTKENGLALAETLRTSPFDVPPEETVPWKFVDINPDAEWDKMRARNLLASIREKASYPGGLTDEQILHISADDVLMLSGEPEPLAVLVPVTLEEGSAPAPVSNPMNLSTAAMRKVRSRKRK